MTLLALSALPFAPARDWASLARRRPPLRRVFATVVLPFALLPPLMVYVAGTQQPEMFPQQLAGAHWTAIAGVFFLAEMLTLFAMGWLLKQVARSNRLAVADDAAYFIAALAPVPLWLSSLGLLFPDLLFTVLIALAALGFSCRALYHGIVALGHVGEPVLAAWMTQVVFGGGLIPWILLLAALLT
jgi:hypothetical protein